MQRREFLAGLAAIGASALVPDVLAEAQTRPATPPFRIDVHYHGNSPGFIAAIKARNTGQAALMNWTPAKALEDMDRDGVATAMMSTSEPSVYFGDAAAARALARECNEYFARLVSDRPTRFGMFATLPLPALAGSAADASSSSPLAVLAELDQPASHQRLLDQAQLGSAALQLAWPWIETPVARAMPEGLSGGDGALAGILARNALARGAFRSAAGLELATVARTWPMLARGDIERSLPDSDADWLGNRLCLIGQRPGAFTLLSDATMAADRALRAGGVARLTGVVIRAARSLGHDLAFEPSGPPLWTRLRRELDDFLARLWRLGALNGALPAEAFTVRCDTTTMSQADLDAGRLIATIEFAPAQPVDRITVTLALTEGGGLQEQEAA